MFATKKKQINSIFYTILFFVICMYIIGASKNIETCDYWWHIKTGEYILSNLKIPTNDIFSWYGIANNLNWISHEWLSEVLLYLPHKYIGQSAGYIVAFILFILSGILIYICNRDAFNQNLIFSLIWIMLGVVVMIPTFNPRPHMFSFVLFIISLKIVYDFILKENSKKIWCMPIISLLWVNLHGGSSNLTYILCIIALITGITDKEWYFVKMHKLSLRKIQVLLIVSCLSIVALTINPHGLKMLLYPYTNMSDTLMLNVIQEWRAPDLKLLNDYPIYILIFCVYLILLKSVKKINCTDFSYILIFTFLTLKSIRFSPFLYVVSTYTVFKYIKKKEWDNKIFSTCTLLLSFMFLVLNIPSLKSSYQYFNNLEIIEQSIIQDINDNDLKKLYNSYDLGGYLIYKDIKPFIDGRADMYSKNILKEYHIISNMILNAKELIEKYNFDAFLIEEGSAIDNYIKDNPSYEKISNNKNYNLYKKIEISI